ncbi:MarR family winged helix-turn-helix transcriptional regulator [Poseidonocella sedimentorum]|uniref:DNA-binding transcriptional regulator, MarR family n=1 Tax=Poseidonocella sedimentorum TaxID=871652 RepID=A0A1I6CQJ3_9RHOB|nr:MarR family transcriptional regulator [Poseidonocella sedimentorum]SFQ95466.1 DNA-binding transcriptional regulator, MarR family [Poseidonocella sedimentorum]
MSDTHLAVLLHRFLRRLHGELRGRLLRCNLAAIGPAGAQVLITLDEEGTLSLKELSETLMRDKSQITRDVKALERADLVTRKPAPSDARVSLMSLTRAGRDAVKMHRRVLADSLGALIGPLGPEDKQTLRALLGRAVDGAPECPDACPAETRETINETQARAGGDPVRPDEIREEPQ